MCKELLPFLTSRASPLDMNGRVYASCDQSSMVYGSDTRPFLSGVGLMSEIAEMQMIDVLFAFRDLWNELVDSYFQIL